MSNTKDKNQQSKDNPKRKSSPITRREIIGAGVVGHSSSSNSEKCDR